ncbi:MAG: Tex family protein [Anaeroplasmataceae bacterium]
MNEDILTNIANNIGVTINHAKVVLQMLEEGSTVPFIARYRKEQTGGMDENQIREIEKAYEYEVNLLKRKEDVIRLIDEKGLLTEDLKNKIMAAGKLVEVEDLYRPYKEKKKTKATEAINLGLEPLAKIMMSNPTTPSREEIAQKYVNDKVNTAEDAITLAMYIIAEWISDNASYRKAIRNNLNKYGIITTKLKKNAVDENEVYKNYYDYKESVNTIKPHRVLAINRAENEDIITVSIEPNKDVDINYLNTKVIKNDKGVFTEDIKKAILDSYKRLIFPSIEREIRSVMSDNASEKAIEIFAMNLKNLLLQAPIKGKVVLGVDPAFRTGCKLAVIDELGAVLDKGVIYPNEKAKGAKVDEALVKKSEEAIVKLVNKYKVDLIAIGNGTASRETEGFISEVIKKNGLNVKYVIVSEAGASVYSASKLAQEEFPDYHVEERSAVSIARRLQDPLAELVKIDPKSIGVGQYQHDVSQTRLSESLDNIVLDVVNKVGVDVNTASVSLLNYVSGVNKNIANNIVNYRNTNGKFKSRKELLNVSKLGSKTYEQCVGFMRIPGAIDELDNTSIHPESYDKAKSIMKMLGINHLGQEAIDKVNSADKDKIHKELDIDMYTLNDILDAFVAPQRDPRDEYSQPKLRSDIMHFEDLKIGDELEGTVRNVVDFGAFVDCGVKYDGLVHISKISDKYIKHPSELLHVGDLVKVYVIGIDLDKHKLSLSMIRE